MNRTFGTGNMPEQQAATKMSSMDKYRFRRALEEIEQDEGRGTELVSVYVPPDRPVFDVTNYLRGEYSQSSNIKSASTRKHVMQAIESIINRLKQWRMPPPNGLVCFVGHKDVGADQTQMIAYVLEPPEAVASFLYRCDSRFYTEPLHEMLAEKDVYGLIVIDRKEATVGLLRGKRQAPPPLRAPDRAGRARVLQEGRGRRDGGVPEPPRNQGDPDRRARVHEGLLPEGGVPPPRTPEEGPRDVRHGLHERERLPGARRERAGGPPRPRPDAGEGPRAAPHGGDPEGGRGPRRVRRGPGPPRPRARGGRHPPRLPGPPEAPAAGG